MNTGILRDFRHGISKALGFAQGEVGKAFLKKKPTGLSIVYHVGVGCITFMIFSTNLELQNTGE